MFPSHNPDFKSEYLGFYHTLSQKKKIYTFFSEKKIRYFYLKRTQEIVSKLFYFANKMPKSIQTEPQGTPSVFVRLFVFFKR